MPSQKGLTGSELDNRKTASCHRLFSCITEVGFRLTAAVGPVTYLPDTGRHPMQLKNTRYSQSSKSIIEACDNIVNGESCLVKKCRGTRYADKKQYKSNWDCTSVIRHLDLDHVGRFHSRPLVAAICGNVGDVCPNDLWDLSDHPHGSATPHFGLGSVHSRAGCCNVHAMGDGT